MGQILTPKIITVYFKKTLIINDEEESKEIEITGTKSYVQKWIRAHSMTNEAYVALKDKQFYRLRDEFGNELIMELKNEKDNSPNPDLQERSDEPSPIIKVRPGVF